MVLITSDIPRVVSYDESGKKEKRFWNLFVTDAGDFLNKSDSFWLLEEYITKFKNYYSQCSGYRHETPLNITI